METRTFQEPGNYSTLDRGPRKNARAKFAAKVEAYHRPRCKGVEGIGETFKVGGLNFCLKRRDDLTGTGRRYFKIHDGDLAVHGEETGDLEQTGIGEYEFEWREEKYRAFFYTVDGRVRLDIEPAKGKKNE